jgi:predicted phage tail protein
MSLFDEFAEGIKVSPTKNFPSVQTGFVTEMPTQVQTPSEYVRPVYQSGSGGFMPGIGSQSSRETIEKLAKAGSAGITKARELFEKMKASRAHKDIDKLEKEIAELEEAKKEALEKAGLEEQKTKLTKELNELKKPKLEAMV